MNDPIEQRARFEDQVCARTAGDDEAMGPDEDFLRMLTPGAGIVRSSDEGDGRTRSLRGISGRHG